MAKREDRIKRVLRKQHNANNKVWRLERNGLRIRNTDENPHVTPSEIRSMSPAELRAHERRLDQFTDRRNQYVRGQDNAPIRRSTVQAYKQLEAWNNELADRVEGAIGDIALPGGDTTIAGLLAMRDKLPQKSNAQQRILQKIDRDIGSVEGEKAMQKLIADFKKRTSNEDIADRIERRMNSIRAALVHSGNADLVGHINQLTLQQKQALIDYSNFGEIAALNIVSPKYSSTGDIRDDWTEEEYDGTDLQDAEELHNNLVQVLNWVKNVNATARTARNAAPRKPRIK